MTESNLLLYCRPGFEKECAAEIMDISTRANLPGYVKARNNSGYVVFMCSTTTTLDKLNQQIPFHAFIFARQLILMQALLKDLPVDDRISPIMDTLQNLPLDVYDVIVETADTNEAKQLSSFCKKFTTPLRQKLKSRKRMDTRSPWRLHLCFLNSTTCYLGLTHKNNSSPYSMGIARLKFPKQAPSRSTLKLEEAFKTMLSEEEASRVLQNGMTAVDLGACPGGWTWQMVQRGIRTIAIDNGAMDEKLMDTGLVTHIAADGFKYRPEKPVDWLICDMVERPLHIARLISQWRVDGDCRYAAFNLKLPMKQRYMIVMQCIELIEDALDEAEIDAEIRVKHLYHDREEVTVIIV